jgi:hypothetical protein
MLFIGPMDSSIKMFPVRRSPSRRESLVYSVGAPMEELLLGAKDAQGLVDGLAASHGAQLRRFLFARSTATCVFSRL